MGGIDKIKGEMRKAKELADQISSMGGVDEIDNEKGVSNRLMIMGN